MQKRRNVKTKIVASLITFMMFFTNFATLGSALVSYAADDSSDAIHYAVEFVEISNADVSETEEEKQEEQVSPTSDVTVPNEAEITEEASSENEEVAEEENSELESVETEVVEPESAETEVAEPENAETDTSDANSEDFSSIGMLIGSSGGEKETTDEENIPAEAEIEDDSTEVPEEVPEEPVVQESTEASNVTEPTSNKVQKLENGYAIKIVVGLKESGYLKNAKVEIKDLANQLFTIKNNVELGDYIQSIDENKIKLKQINSGTEIEVYVPIEIKNEESIDIEKLQNGTTFNLTATYVTTEGIEEVITKSESPKLSINNTSNLVVNSQFEKLIPYIKENVNYALAQIKVVSGSTNTVNLPVMDNVVEVELPVIDGAEISDVNVVAISTAYTNGLANGDVQFTVENWKYENGVVTITVNNNPRDGRYYISNGVDEYVITFTYNNYPEQSPGVLQAGTRARANVFNSEGTQELNNEITSEYDLSQANSNIITYEVAGNTQEFSKGYLYGNLNAQNPEYSIEYENNLNVNISRVELLNIVEIREAEEYFEDANGNRYSTTTNEGNNSYYKSVRFNRNNLNTILGENGTFELLNDNAEQLIEINKDTPDDGDGFITVGFGDSKIDKVLFRINNPEGDGILSITATKRIDKTTYNKVDLVQFTSLKADYVAAAALEGDVVTDMGSTQVGIDLLDTMSAATVSVSRTDLSTLVENEDVEISINLNNADESSDIYKNPVFELKLPRKVESVLINDISVLYGNGELDLNGYEIIDNGGSIIIRVSLIGAQTRYAFGDSNIGTTVILKTNMTVDKYNASSNGLIEMKYFNEDATRYAFEEEWAMETGITSEALITENGYDSTALNIVAPEGLINAQAISGYNGNRRVMSINQGFKNDAVETFADMQNAEMKMITINNTGEELSDVRILGRTIFAGNTTITDNVAIGTNQNAPMVSGIVAEDGNTLPCTIYYSENGTATDSLEDSENAWTTTPEDYRKVKSYLIVVNEVLQKGEVVSYKYNFEIPEKLSNEIDMAGTFATYYTGEKTKGLVEADKVMLSTGEAPVLNVEIVSDTDVNSAVGGQHIKFTARVTNQGSTVARNVVIDAIIPEATIYMENGVEREDVNELKFTIDEIRPGNVEEREYEVKVRETVPDQTYVEPTVQVDADGLEKPSYVESEEKMPVKRPAAKIFITSNSDNRKYQPGKEITYTTTVQNKTDVLTDAIIVQKIPENVEVLEAYTEEFMENGIDTYKGENAEINLDQGTVTYRIDEIKKFKCFKMTVRLGDIEGYDKTVVTTASLTANGLNEEYKSNELAVNIGKAKLGIRSYSSSDNKYIKEGEIVKYVLQLTNESDVEASNISIQNAIPSEFYVTSFEGVVGNTVTQGLAGNVLNMSLTIPAGQVAEIIATCTAKNLDNSIDEKGTTNNWVVSGNNINNFQTSKYQNIVQQNKKLADIPTTTTDFTVLKEEEEYVPNSLKEVTLNEKEEIVKEETYRIIGKAFNDFDKNGQRDDNEEGMENIVAKLCDAKTQEVVGQTTTNKVGEYLFDNIKAGEYYVKFEYDKDKYALTSYKKAGVTADRNSDAIVSNYKAVTDKITIKDKSVSDIDIGLYRAGIFDLDLDVNINQVTVQNPEETTTLTMENPKLAKYDVKPQYTNDTTLLIEYTIDVSNKGELSGYAKRIVDYIPDGLELYSQENNNWYVGSDGNAYNNELEDVEIKPGETKTIKLILMKKMTEDDTGIYNNVFEIAQAYNEYAIEDIDSTPGNNVQDEDDMARADIIIGIQTGGSVVNVMIISTTLITLLVALYAIKIHIDKKNKEVIV